MKLEEIYIFDKDINHVATIDNFTNVEWIENFDDVDTFSIKLDFEIIKDTNNDKYSYYKDIFDTMEIYRNSKNPFYVAINFFDKTDLRAGIIENYNINELEHTMEIKGRGALALFEYKEDYDKEYIPTVETNDSIGSVVCDILNLHIATDPILNVFVADRELNTIGDEVFYITESGNTVLESVTTLLKHGNLGFKTLLDYENKKINLFIYQVDADASVAVSLDDGNLTGNEFEFDIANYKNYITIQGTFEDGDTEKLIIENVDKSNGEMIYSMNYESSKKSETMTEAQFREALRLEAEIELENNNAEDLFTIDVSENVLIDIGGKAVVKLDVGYKEIAKEITAKSVSHSFTKTEYTRAVDFGEAENLKSELKYILGVK